jgi:Tfp pilus assembly protein PilX
VRIRPTLRIIRRRRPEDDGVALLTVIGTMGILTLFLLSTLAFVLANTTPSRKDQDAKAALAAAEAGVDEYISRLNANDSYWTTGNTDATNTAFNASGRDVPGTNGASATFKYQLLTTPTDTATSGQIRLQVTGISSPRNGVEPVSRTITATLQPRGFLNFIYFSDVEAVDPALYANLANATYNGNWYNGSGSRYWYLAEPAKVNTDCAKHYYEGRDNPSYTATSTNKVYIYDSSNGVITGNLTTGGTVAGYCDEIRFITGDVIQGPLHSNDSLQIQGSVLFTDPLTESSWSNPPSSTHRWWGSGTPSSGTTGQPGYLPVYAAALSMPSGNEELLQYVEPRVDSPGAPAGPGCYYQGQTRIIFQGTTMKVLSPSTTTAPSRCLDTANRANEQVKNIPPVIYVDSTATSCTAGALGYPKSNEWTGGITTDYTCTRGTALVQGTVDGQVTVAAKDDVVVTGDLVTQDNLTGTDVIGLIGGNYVWVYHPVTSSGTNILTSTATPHNIQAAILSLRHSFLVQNWAYGSLLSTSTAYKLNVTGAIAQKFRGPVGTSTNSGPYSGYVKNYVYDARFKVLQPPYFLKPTSSPWQVASISDK